MLTGTADESRWSRRSATLARRLGVADRVCFAGDVPNRAIPELIQRARLLAFPTWCESFGLPVAEGLAMGAPVVAADIPACREVGADAARYYTTGSVQSMAETIGGLLDSPDAAAQLGTAAHARGRSFTWRDNALAVRRSLLNAVA
jgi:alpha-1,3-rhamnosyl/mannosyltransferase